MSWYLSFFGALAVMGLGAGLLLCKKIKPLHVLIGTVFCVSLLLGFAPEYVWSEGYIAEAVVSTFTQGMLVFTGEAEYAAMNWTVHMAPKWMQTPYSWLLLLIQIVAPILTFGFLLSMFKNVSGYFRLFLGKFRDIYVFSSLNEKSASLAEDIHRNHPKAKIFFADVYDSENDTMAELAHRVKKFGGVCFKHSITSIRFEGQKGSVTFFAISENEAQNIHQSIKLMERYGARSNTNLYLFSTGAEGELLLSGMERGAMKVRRVHEDRALVYRLLYEQGESLFATAVDHQIHAVILGLDGRGREMLKALSWFGQMDGYRLIIHAFDADPQAESVFTAQCPELMSMSGTQIPGEAQYEIHIHSDCPADSAKFAEKIQSIPATWVFVTTGSDEQNIRTAAMLRSLFRRNGSNPQIRAVIGDGGICPVVESAVNHAGQSYEIMAVGSISTNYTEAVIMQSDAEADAFRRHKAYCNGNADREEDFWRQEYCYRSSMASAIHATARKKCLSCAQVPENALSDDQRQILEQLEHRRWNAYMRSEGYIFGDKRDDLAKKHHNLVPFAKLSQSDQRKDSRVAAQNR